MAAEHRHNLPPLLIQRARELRRARIPAESKLWQCLRNRQLGGFKFRRNQPTPPFIADFYCAEMRLIVELDGGSHESRKEYDESRTVRLERLQNNCRTRLVSYFRFASPRFADPREHRLQFTHRHHPQSRRRDLFIDMAPDIIDHLRRVSACLFKWLTNPAQEPVQLILCC